MRPRALALLLAITVGDYVLWHWSVNAGHDAVALAAGLTLPPLGTVTVGALGLGVLRLLGHSLRHPSASRLRRLSGARRSARRSTRPRKQPPRPPQPKGGQAPTANSPQADPSSEKLAA